MRIMNTSYIKNADMEQKFKNREASDLKGDDEFRKFKEEETNTKKMSTILKNINSPRRKTQENFYTNG